MKSNNVIPSLHQVALLRRHVDLLTHETTERSNRRYQALETATRFIEAELASYGLPARRQTYLSGRRPCHVVVAETNGRSEQTPVVIATHYDTRRGRVGGKDNVTGVAAALTLAASLAGCFTAKPIRFVVFINDDPLLQRRNHTASMLYAQHCRNHGERMALVLCLESIGYETESRFDGEAGKEHGGWRAGTVRPLLFMTVAPHGPDVGALAQTFKKSADHPVRSFRLPAFLRRFSAVDAWGFADQAFPTLAVTDEAPWRRTGTQQQGIRLNYEHLAAIVGGLEALVLQAAEH